jgi:hypothetical protein
MFQLSDSKLWAMVAGSTEPLKTIGHGSQSNVIREKKTIPVVVESYQDG